MNKQLFSIGKKLFYASAIFVSTQLSAQTITWSAKDSMPVVGGLGRNAAMCMAIGSKIYVGGGYTASNTNSNEFYEYNPATNHWTKKADLPGAASRSAGIAFSVGGKGYIGLGAENYLTISGVTTLLNDLWEYDTLANTWSPKAALPDSARSNSLCFVINNKAYVVGGEITATGFTTADVWEYNPSTNSWAPKTSFPGQVENAFAFALGTGAAAKGYISCGSVDYIGSKKTYAYDATANSWTPKADYPGSALKGGVAFTIGNKAYCGLGTINYSAYSDTFYTYDGTAGTWSTAITSFPAAKRAFGYATSIGYKGYVGGGWTVNTSSGAQSFYRDWYSLNYPVGISEIEKAAQLATCYPNPATGKITIEVPDNSVRSGMLSIYDLAGKNILTTAWNVGKPVDVAQLATGAYFAELKADVAIFHTHFLVAHL